jgi:hypothetical protein
VNILSRDATQSFRVPRRDSNPGSSQPESDALTTRPLRLTTAPEIIDVRNARSRDNACISSVTQLNEFHKKIMKLVVTYC